MNKEQEELIASGIYLLVKSAGYLRPAEKKVWIDDFDELFGEHEEPTISDKTKDALNVAGEQDGK